MTSIEIFEQNYPVLRTNYTMPRAYGIPIELREEVLKMYRDANIPVRIRNRGPRAASIGRVITTNTGRTYVRTRKQARQDCLPEDATHFTVYNR
jgi:hypothetical protein